jgi:hypothetical protein
MEKRDFHTKKLHSLCSAHMMKYQQIKRSHGKDTYIKSWLETLKEVSHLGHNHDDDDNNIKMDVKRHEL